MFQPSLSASELEAVRLRVSEEEFASIQEALREEALSQTQDLTQSTGTPPRQTIRNIMDKYGLLPSAAMLADDKGNSAPVLPLRAAGNSTTTPKDDDELEEGEIVERSIAEPTPKRKRERGWPGSRCGEEEEEEDSSFELVERLQQ